MKLKETIYASEWHDNSGWAYEDCLVSIKECDFPHLSYYDPEEFDWNDYADYYSVDVPNGVDLFITVKFSDPDDGVVYSISEWASVLKAFDGINDVNDINDVVV